MLKVHSRALLDLRSALEMDGEQVDYPSIQILLRITQNEIGPGEQFISLFKCTIPPLDLRLIH